MKKIIFYAGVIIALLFLCYHLLFVSFAIGSVHMESDADVDKAGEIFLFFIFPVIFIGGIWIARHVFCIITGLTKYKNYIAVLLSLYGGGFGVMFINFLIFSLLSIRIEDRFIAFTIMAASFVISAIVTFHIAKKQLLKIQASTEKHAVCCAR
ncbi:MAG: hypothetical protein LBE78_11775 [Burkholderiaceae bacterium]|jgi:hypothetical protein|nr:hypothetical protein [Burkholderiaceae bacterium]